MSAYRNDAGYEGLARALARGRETTLAEVDVSGVRGRGGAAFPASGKWRAASAQPDGPRIVVVNADESDPGAYIDRFLLEVDAHDVLEGLAPPY